MKIGNEILMLWDQYHPIITPTIEGQQPLGIVAWSPLIADLVDDSGWPLHGDGTHFAEEEWVSITLRNVARNATKTQLNQCVALLFEHLGPRLFPGYSYSTHTKQFVIFQHTPPRNQAQAA